MRSCTHTDYDVISTGFVIARRDERRTRVCDIDARVSDRNVTGKVMHHAFLVCDVVLVQFERMEIWNTILLVYFWNNDCDMYMYIR